MADGVYHTQSQSFSTGRVFGRAFGTITANPIAAVAIALLFGALPSEAWEYSYTHLLGFGAPKQTSMLSIAGGVSASIAAMLFPVLAQGAFIRLTVAHEEGRRPGFAEAGITGVRALVPLFGLGLVTGLGTTIGLIMLIVPGIFMLLMWAVAAPVLIEERCGIRAALRGSTSLAEGSWGSILAIGLIVGVVESALAYLLPELTGFYSDAARLNAAVDPFPVLYLSVELLVATLTTTLSAAVYTSLYIELRNFKHGTPEDALAEIFA